MKNKIKEVIKIISKAKKVFSLRLIIAVGVIILLFAGIYFAYAQFKSYQAKQAEKERQAQELIESQQKTLEETQQRLEALENKEPQVIVKEVPITREVPTQENQTEKENDLSSIIKQWQPLVAYIECNFYYTNGEWYLTQSGSGVLEKTTPSSKLAETIILTNLHVVTDQMRYRPVNCTVKFPNNPSIFVDNSSYDAVYSATGLENDWAIINLRNPPAYIKNLTHSLDMCERSEVSIGDEMVILGYPAIGSKTDITATEGIISGYDGDYYITSAKIDRGNSGGAAILLKNNCYLGIPTFAKVGDIESLGRILDMNKMLTD